MRLFPWIHATQEGLRFGYQLLYLLDSTPFYTPVLHLLGQNIVRVSGQEMVSHGAITDCRSCADVVLKLLLELSLAELCRLSLQALTTCRNNFVACSEVERSLQIEVQRQQQQRRQLQLEAAQRSPSVILRLLSQGWLKSTYAFADHTRNALILSVFAFKVRLGRVPCAFVPWCISASHSHLAIDLQLLLFNVCKLLQHCMYASLLFMPMLPSLLTSSGSQLAGKHVFIERICYVQLLEWWYTSAEEKLGAQQALPPPPPPPPPKPSPDGLQLPDDATLCPICKRKRTNPGMASVSGYVYCYPCIFGSIDQHGCCPVTRLPATVDQIRRLYQSA